MATYPTPEQTRVLLINAFEKLPGENFRDQRYTFLYEMLKRRATVTWLSSDFHHWSHTRRSVAMLPAEDRLSIRLIRTLSYQRNVGVRRVLSYFGLSIATFWNLLRLRQRPDTIVCMGAVEQMLFAVLYGRLRRVPVVIDVIDPWPDVYLKAFSPSVRWLGRVLLIPYFIMSYLTFSLCARVTAVSDTYLQWAIHRGRRTDRESFRCYYLGARNDEFNVATVPEASASVACLFAGQFGFSYDIELILDAAEALQAAGRNDIRFVLCGAGDKQSEVTRRARSLNNVELHGWVNPAELNAIGAHCQVGLCTYSASATQSIPTKLFDYFSMGLYVVSSLAGEAEAMLRAHDIGRNYTAGDVQSFIDCIVQIREQVDLGPGRRAAIRTTFDRHFSSEVIYRKMIEEVVLPAAAVGRSAGGAISA